jgi:hypothetical protein
MTSDETDNLTMCAYQNMTFGHFIWLSSRSYVTLDLPPLGAMEMKE